MKIKTSTLARCTGAAALSAAIFANPAKAHHTGPAGIGDQGGGLAVQGPDTLDAGKAAVGFQLTYLRTEQRSASELADLAAQDVHAHDTNYTANGVIGLAYGITHRLTLTAELPFVRRAGLREGVAVPPRVNRLGNVTGLGDASLIAKYRIAGTSERGLAIIGGIKLPTGATHRLSEEGELLETEHQPGSGSWDFYLGAAAGTVLGPISLDASALYQFTTTGSQQTRLGDRLQAGLSLSHRFGGEEHHLHHHDDSDEDHDHGHASVHLFGETTVEWEGRQRVAGAVEAATGGTALWLSGGARFNAASGFSLTLAGGIPAWQDVRPSHAPGRFRLTLALGKTL